MSLSLSVRTVAVSAVLAGTAVSASAAGIAIPVNAFVANSVQDFSIEANANFRQVGIQVSAKGTAYANADKTNSFTLPVTSISISPLLKILSGTAVGSALQFDRIAEDEETGEEVPITPRRVVTFRPSQMLREFVEKGGRGRAKT